MTRKTLIGVAVASTFGWTAAAHAGSNHQASWVAAGDEQYPPMVMFEGPSANTLATVPAPGPESVGSASTDAGTVSAFAALRAATASALSRTTKSRMRRSTVSSSSSESEWVAAGDEQYPPMVMFEGLSTNTLASTSPDMLAGTSTETNESIGSTVAAPSDSVGTAPPSEPPANPSLSTGTDMHSGKEGESFGTNPDALDVASDGVYTEYYVVSWTPMTSADWDVYTITFESESKTLVPTNEGDSLITTYDVIVLPSDSSSAGELTTVPGPTKEDSPG